MPSILFSIIFFLREHHQFMVMGIKQEIHIDRRSTKNVSMNGVIITVYVESPTIHLLHKNDPIKRINPKPFSSRPRTVRTHGYDRRAQLLAYAQELRHANSKQPQWPKKNSKPKKWWRWPPSSERLRLSFSRLFYRPKRQWRYERLVSEEQSEADGSNGPERINNSKNTRASGRSNSHICSRLRSMLKELSCGWHCNKGY